jgi:kynureninase
MRPPNSRAECLAADRDDPLAHARERFALPSETIYLDGNSLGALPTLTASRLASTIEQDWGVGLIRSWNSADWVNLPAKVGQNLSRLIGASPDEVIVADSTSANIYKLVAAELDHVTRSSAGGARRRRVVLSERGNFPTDLYLAAGLVAASQGRFVLQTVDTHDLIHALTDEVACALITHVDYRSGRMHNMAGLNDAARAAGTRIIWDLSHSAGAVPLNLHQDGTELAVGCGYKYLNGGPGAPAFIYVARYLLPMRQSPLQGWFGHTSPFTFDASYQPSGDIRRFQCGTPPILGLVALDAGIETFNDIQMSAIRAKSVALSECFAQRMQTLAPVLGVLPASPDDAAIRGSHLAYRHSHAYAVMQALITAGVIGDFREPDLLRFGFTPLYTRFVDCFDAVEALRKILSDELWRDTKYRSRNTVV